MQNRFLILMLLYPFLLYSQNERHFYYEVTHKECQSYGYDSLINFRDSVTSKVYLEVVLDNENKKLKEVLCFLEDGKIQKSIRYYDNSKKMNLKRDWAFSTRKDSSIIIFNKKGLLLQESVFDYQHGIHGFWGNLYRCYFYDEKDRLIKVVHKEQRGGGNNQIYTTNEISLCYNEDNNVYLQKEIDCFDSNEDENIYFFYKNKKKFESCVYSNEREMSAHIYDDLEILIASYYYNSYLDKTCQTYLAKRIKRFPRKIMKKTALYK